VSEAPWIRQLAGEVRIHDSLTELAGEAAAWIVSTANAATRQHGTFSIALSGGHTPSPVLEKVAAEPLRSSLGWPSWRVYFADERAVRPDDPESNYSLVRQTLLDRVPIPENAIHRMEGERPDLDAAAAEYSALLAATLPLLNGGAPRLDCILLGLGENGHTASLFPGTEALDVADSWATRGRADYAPYDRITLTFPAINAAASVAFLVAGASKRAALRGVVDGTVPAARVRPSDAALIWFLDRDAASEEPAAG